MSETLDDLSSILSQSTVCSQLLLPNIQIGVVSSISVILQQQRTDNKAPKGILYLDQFKLSQFIIIYIIGL